MKSRRANGGSVHSGFGKCQQFLDALHYTGCIPPLLRQFHQLTGWGLSYESVDLRFRSSWLLDGDVSVDLSTAQWRKPAANAPAGSAKSMNTGSGMDAGMGTGLEAGLEADLEASLGTGWETGSGTDAKMDWGALGTQGEASISSPRQSEDISPVRLIRISGRLPQDADLPTPLTPEMARSMADEEELWIPIKISNEFLPEALITQNALQGKDRSPIGFLHLYRLPGVVEMVDFPTAKRAATAIGDCLTDFQTVRVRLWNLESGITPDTRIYNMATANQRSDFAQRSNAMLAYAQEALNFDAIAIYTFTNQGSTLRWKTGVNLPLDHQKEPSRPPVPAEMLALQGQTVVCDQNNHQPSNFCMPEAFESAICLPLLTNRTNFGTIWFYSDRYKRFPESKIRQAELLADHIALDYEQETFFQRYHTSLEFSSELRATAEFQKNQLPVPPVLQEPLEFFGWTNQTRMVKKLERDTQPAVCEESVSGDFFDWFTLADGRTVVALGDVGHSGLVGAALVAAVKSTVRSHAMYQRTASSLLQSVHQTLWPQSAGDYRISLFCGLIDPQKDPNDPAEPRRIQFASVGKLHALYLHEALTYDVLLRESDVSVGRFLGGSPEFTCSENTLYLSQNESLVLFNPGELNGESVPVSDSQMADLLLERNSSSARLQTVFVKNALLRHVPENQSVDQSVLVIRHRTPVRKFRKRVKVS